MESIHPGNKLPNHSLTLVQERYNEEVRSDKTVVENFLETYALCGLFKASTAGITVHDHNI